MKMAFVSLSILIFTLSACSPAVDETINNNNPSTQQIGNYIPGPADSKMIRNGVFLDSVEMLSMESFPLQFALLLKGNLPTPCHNLRISANQPDQEKKIVIEVYSVTNPNTVCIMILEPFEANFQLGSYPTGHYTVWINDKLVTEFDS